MTNNTNNFYDALKVEKLENAELSITGEVPLGRIEELRPRVLKDLQKNLDLPGFRKGHVPEKVIVERMGEPSILSEVAELALQAAYPKIITDEKLDVLGQPQVTLTKLAAGNPIGFSIKVATLPEVTLPDYKKISKDIFSKEDKVNVDQKEIDETIAQIEKSLTQSSRDNSKENTEQKPGEQKEVELTDELVKTLGDFKDLADFKTKMEANILEEKKRKARENKRVEAGEKIIEASTIVLPRILIESELEKMIAQFKGDVERMGLTYEKYLAEVKKTEEDMKKDWEKDAEKRAKLQLILNKIASEEHITPKREDVDREIGHIQEHMSEANPERVRVYVETMLTNEEVFRFLENGGTGEEKIQEKTPEEKEK